MTTDKDTIRELAQANAELSLQILELEKYRDAQKIIAQAVTDRGYRAGWTPAQFIARQVVKLGEELGELAANMNLPAQAGGLYKTGQVCRKLFDSQPIWRIITPQISIQHAKKEAADMLIVLLNLAASISELEGDHFDLIEAALQKAEQDQKRGVR